MTNRRGKNQDKKNPKIEVFNVTLSQVDRSYKGIDEWRNALKAAESIQNPRRKLLYDLYEEVALDGHLTSVMGKRKMKVTNTTIKFFDRNGKEDETINKLLEKEWFEDMLNDILDSRFYGYSLLWFKELNQKKVDYKLIDRKHVRPELGHVIKEVYDCEGIDYTDPIYDKYTLTAGKPKDLGLLLKAAPYVIYKKGDVGDWSIFNQIFGFPFREFTYEGNDPAVKRELENIGRQTMTAPFAVLPSTANMKLHESGGKSGSSELFKHLAEFCDDQNSKLVLCNTMTTDAKGGNYKGEVHKESEEEVEKADKRFIIRILNEKFTKILETFGYNVEGGRFAYESKEDPSKLLDMYVKLKKDLGVDFDLDHLYETFNIPKPKNKPKKEEPQEPEPSKPDNPDPKTKEDKQEKKEKDKKKKKLSERSALRKILNLFSSFPWAE
jgi:phage gp29-like protein